MKITEIKFSILPDMFSEKGISREAVRFHCPKVYPEMLEIDFDDVFAMLKFLEDRSIIVEICAEESVGPERLILNRISDLYVEDNIIGDQPGDELWIELPVYKFTHSCGSDRRKLYLDGICQALQMYQYDLDAFNIDDLLRSG